MGYFASGGTKTARPKSEISLKTIRGDREYWRALPEYPGYEFSSLGRVKRITFVDTIGRVCKEKFLKLIIQKNKDSNYIQVLVNLKERAHILARLILKAFRGNPPKEKPQARHLDSNSFNNNIRNLVWGDAQENADDRVRMGRHLASKEQCIKISKALKGRIFSDIHKERLSIAGRNRIPISEITRSRMSAAAKTRVGA